MEMRTGLNECSRVYGVPKVTIRRRAMKKNWYMNGVKALGRRSYVLWVYGADSS
jgi:hypothetical protein